MGAATAKFRGGTHIYEPGDQIYVRPSRWLVNASSEEQLHGYLERWMVKEQLQHRGWPHYRMTDPIGNEWIISQLEVSNVPFSNFRVR